MAEELSGWRQPDPLNSAGVMLRLEWTPQPLSKLACLRAGDSQRGEGEDVSAVEVIRLFKRKDIKFCSVVPLNSVFLDA